MDIEPLIKQALVGDKTALEGVISSVQDKVYYLSLRMLVDPEDARDASQEILIKIMTNLSSFRFESQFSSWVYRLASNYLISERRSKYSKAGLNFEMFKQDQESDLQDAGNLKQQADYPVLLNELRISCTMAMLLCLTPPLRMTYILGYILEVDHQEGSELLGIAKDTFRQQLSRAKAKVFDFTQSSCGLVNKQAPCHCDRKLTGAIRRGRVDSKRIFYSSAKQYSHAQVQQSLHDTQQELRSLALQKSFNLFKSPDDLSQVIEQLVSEGLRIQTVRLSHKVKLR